MDNSELHTYFVDGKRAIYDLNSKNNLSIKDAVKQYNQELLSGKPRFIRRQIITDSKDDNDETGSIIEDIVLEDNNLQTQLNNYHYYWMMKKPTL